MGIIPGGGSSTAVVSGIVTTENASKINANSRLGNVTVGITATPLRVDIADLPNRRFIQIQNNAMSAIYVAFTNTVSTTNGAFVASGATVSYDLDPASPITLYGITSGNPGSVNVLEV